MPTAKLSERSCADIDAERRDGFEVERAGADADAEPGVAQQHEQQRDRDRPPSPP